MVRRGAHDALVLRVNETIGEVEVGEEQPTSNPSEESKADEVKE